MDHFARNINRKTGNINRMNEKQHKFVLAYIASANATKSAVSAGYSAKTADRIGSRLLKHAEVKKAIEEGRQKTLKQAEEECFLSYTRKRTILAEVANNPESSVKDVLRAIEIDNIMAGDNAPQKMDVQSNDESFRPVFNFR